MRPTTYKIGIISLVSVSVIITVIAAYTAFDSYFYLPGKIKDPIMLKDTPIRIGGQVKPGSLKIMGRTARFVLRDEKKEIIIHYKGEIPDFLKERSYVVAQGNSISDTGLQANKILNEYFFYYILASYLIAAIILIASIYIPMRNSRSIMHQLQQGQDQY